MKKSILFLFLIILFSSVVAAVEVFDCKYNSQPYIREKIPYVFEERDKIRWMCNITGSNPSGHECSTFVFWNNTLIQSNPDFEYTKGIGLEDHFISEPAAQGSQLVNVFFTNKDLRHDRNVTFKVICSHDTNQVLTFEANVTPQYKDVYQVFDVAEYGRTNAVYVIGFVFLLLFLIIIGGIIWRLATN